MIDLIRRMIDPVLRRVMVMVGRCVVESVDDSKKMQELKTTLSAGETRSDVERIQNYGLTSVPVAGAEALALAVGGNRDHTVIVAVDDRRYRIKNLAAGEVAVYNNTGAKIVMKADGSIEIVPALLGNVKIGGTLLTQAVATEAFALAVCTALTTLTGGVFPATPDLIPGALSTKAKVL